MKPYHPHRRGIALYTAIAFMLVMATIMGLMLSMTAQTSKRGADLYFQEQAHMLAKSATEFALLAISGHDRGATGNCVNTITSQYPQGTPIYTIDTTIRYLGNGFPVGNCNLITDANGIALNNVQTPESNGTIMIDVYVTLNANAAGTTEDIRYHRRTLQKP